MVNKPPKPAKAPKANKRANRNNNDAASQAFMSSFGEDSFFTRSQQFVKENDAKPFRDFAYMITFIEIVFIWRLYAAIKSNGSTGLWSFLVFGMIAMLNLWTYFLVQICARRGGDIGIVKIADDDILRFIRISGLFGAWASIIYFGYRSKDPNFFSKALKASVLNLFWLAVFVKFYL
ncbi:hypothetical protein BX616_004383 [Lobosporangium transversale]|nr:hypothetical protein BX616_004383 [Lobosporangium transversale]